MKVYLNMVNRKLIEIKVFYNKYLVLGRIIVFEYWLLKFQLPCECLNVIGRYPKLLWNKVSVNPHLCMSGIKLSQFAKTSLNIGLQEIDVTNLLFSFFSIADVNFMFLCCLLRSFLNLT